MKFSNLKIAIGLGIAMTAGAVQAAGPLYLWEGGEELKPYTWDTSNGPIPVYTDGGDAFTWLDEEETEVFISIERANEITQFAFDEWNNVSTSTFEAQIAGTIESQIGVADVDGSNSDILYGEENGYGFWVLYDTDGSILEEQFGVPRTAVLGIAFPEWANEDTGEITEATAVINGWNVHISDTEGNNVAGVFTHEFGHAINLSHSQTNGQMVYMSYTYAPKYPGPKGCVDPLYRWDYPPFYGLDTADPAHNETMFPSINHTALAGAEQSTVDMPDDIAAISNLYPTADFKAITGTISGVLRLKDGSMEYSGINVIARNINDPMGDAVSAMTGDQTQGLVGPDGRYTITNLTPGESYVVYIEEIIAGGYPTTPTPIVSIAEYWNSAESNDPGLDDACDATPILAEAGVTKTADITFNGYLKGIDYTPIVSAHLTDLAKNGKSAAGLAGNTAFIWDENKGFMVLPEQVIASLGGQITRNGQKMLVLYDDNNDGLAQAAIWSRNGSIQSLGDLNGGTCGGTSADGTKSSTGWAIDDTGRTAVGLAYIDVDGDGRCTNSRAGELVPWVWTAGKKGGMRQLSTEGAPRPTSWIRAHAISGNGKVIMGNNGGSAAVAWVDGELIDLYNMYDVLDVYASSYDGTRVALSTFKDGVLLWNALDPAAEVENIGGLTWCVDMDFINFGRNFCELMGPEWVQQTLGPMRVMPFDMNDEGTVIIGRAGDLRAGILGAMWIEDIGWINFKDFFHKQGVVEVGNFPMDNPLSISGSGREMVGGLAGVSFAWHVNMDQVYVCQDGVTVQTGFPNGLREMVADGAEFGRCEFLD